MEANDEMIAKDEEVSSLSTEPRQLEANDDTAIDPNIIDFDGPDDPYNAMNWPMRKKIVTTLLYSFTTLGATWASTA